MTTVLVILLLIVAVGGAYGWVLFSREQQKHLETRSQLAVMIQDKQAEEYAQEVPVIEPVERVIPEVSIEEARKYTKPNLSAPIEFFRRQKKALEARLESVQSRNEETKVLPEPSVKEETVEEPEFALPPSIEPFKAVLWVIIGKEAQLKYGAKDILGDDWLRLRRIASRFKKLNPSLDNHEIFRAILICYKEMEYVSAQRVLDVDQRQSNAAVS